MWPRALRHRVVCKSLNTALFFLEEATSQACTAQCLLSLTPSTTASGPSAVRQHANPPTTNQLSAVAAASQAAEHAAATSRDAACDLAVAIWLRQATALIKKPDSVWAQYLGLIQRLQLKALGLHMIEKLQV